ncbi:hypothetical protein JTB14_017852 [Gonioctena quinquepunctata]|nr:hypothetical protein JTB14_017852 [Gonioctena quinquepunctata]
MFAKFLPTTNETVKDISILAFKKEAFIYRDFIPKLKEVGFQGIADIAPDCYFIRTGNVMVFDDLPISNYTSSDLSIPEGYEWLSLAFKKLAQFHACSILLENKCDMKIESEYKEYLNEVFWAREESSSGGVMKCSVRTTIEYFVSKFPDLLKYSTLNECKRKIESAFDLMYRQIIMSEKHMNVICHGDVWAANILTKKVENIPKSCYLIDFQLIRYCPPMVDVLFLLYMNTTKQIRSEYKLKLLDIYYEAQMNILKEYNMNIEDIYSKQDFLSLYREFESTAICQAICYQQILLVPKKTLHAINNDELISKNFYQIDRSDIFDEVLETDEEYRTRMRAIMEDLYDVLDI